MALSKWLSILLLLVCVGCNDVETAAPILDEKPAHPTAKELQDKWLFAYADAANLYTERTYQCMTEMYSRAFDPNAKRVNDGPICRESCKLKAAVNEMVRTAPPYIPDAGKYLLGESDVCKSADHRNRKRGSR